MSRRLLGLLGGLALLALAGLLTSPIALLLLLLFRPRSGALPKIIDEAATPFADIGQLVRPLFFVAFAILIVIWAVARLSADATILDTPFAQLTLMNLGALCSIAAVALIALLQNPPVPAPKPTSEKISIFVGPQTRDGFVDIDHGVLDSINDLKAELGSDKRLQLVGEKAHARLVLEVLSRGATSTNGGGAMALPIGAASSNRCHDSRRTRRPLSRRCASARRAGGEDVQQHRHS